MLVSVKVCGLLCSSWWFDQKPPLRLNGAGLINANLALTDWWEMGSLHSAVRLLKSQEQGENTERLSSLGMGFRSKGLYQSTGLSLETKPCEPEIRNLAIVWKNSISSNWGALDRLGFTVEQQRESGAVLLLCATATRAHDGPVFQLAPKARLVTMATTQPAGRKGYAVWL